MTNTGIFEDVTPVNDFLIPNRENERKKLKQFVEKKLAKMKKAKVINLSTNRDDFYFLYVIRNSGVLRSKNTPALRERLTLEALLRLMPIMTSKEAKKEKEYHVANKTIKAMWEYSLALARAARTGQYGICMGCSQDISPGKLIRNPITVFCYKCEKKLKQS